MSDPARPPPPPESPPLMVGAAVAYAWRAFRSNIAALALLALVVLATQVGLGLVGQAIERGGAGDSPVAAVTLGVASVGFTLLSFVVGLMLAVGLLRAALAVMDGETPSPSLLFRTDGLLTYLLAAALFSVTTAVGLIACVIPGLVVAFLWQFFGYAVVDGAGSVSATGALGRSFAVVRANVGELLVLWVAFFFAGLIIGIAALVPVLGWIVAVLAALVFYPVVALSLAYAWRTLTGGVVAAVR